MKSVISENLQFLRKNAKFSQEELADKLSVSRQAVAKWENGETVPDIVNCQKLADLYGVKLDDLVNYSSETAENNGLPIPPKGKHVFGTTTVGERGQIVLPKKARDIFDIKAGDSLLVLGDEASGIALMKTDGLMGLFKNIFGKKE